MAGSFSDYLENKVLDHVFKVASYAVPSGLYVGLFTVAPTDAGGGTEVAGGDYARVVCNSWSAASAGATANTIDIIFPLANAEWGTVVAAGIFDESTGGNLIAWGDLTVPKLVQVGDVFEILTGNLDVTLA